MITTDAVLDRFENKVEISGAVYRAGLYQLDGTVNMVKQLIRGRLKVFVVMPSWVVYCWTVRKKTIPTK